MGQKFIVIFTLAFPSRRKSYGSIYLSMIKKVIFYKPCRQYHNFSRVIKNYNFKNETLNYFGCFLGSWGWNEYSTIVKIKFFYIIFTDKKIVLSGGG